MCRQAYDASLSSFTLTCRAFASDLAAHTITVSATGDVVFGAYTSGLDVVELTAVSDTQAVLCARHKQNQVTGACWVMTVGADGSMALGPEFPLDREFSPYSNEIRVAASGVQNGFRLCYGDGPSSSDFFFTCVKGTAATSPCSLAVAYLLTPPTLRHH
jgi:hypothetical protein